MSIVHDSVEKSYEYSGCYYGSSTELESSAIYPFKNSTTPSGKGVLNIERQSGKLSLFINYRGQGSKKFLVRSISLYNAKTENEKKRAMIAYGVKKNKNFVYKLEKNVMSYSSESSIPMMNMKKISSYSVNSESDYRNFIKMIFGENAMIYKDGQEAEINYKSSDDIKVKEPLP